MVAWYFVVTGEAFEGKEVLYPAGRFVFILRAEEPVKRPWQVAAPHRASKSPLSFRRDAVVLCFIICSFIKSVSSVIRYAAKQWCSKKEWCQKKRKELWRIKYLPGFLETGRTTFICCVTEIKNVWPPTGQVSRCISSWATFVFAFSLSGFRVIDQSLHLSAGDWLRLERYLLERTGAAWRK